MAIQFEESQFNRIFPFYILIKEDMTVSSIGKTLEKIFIEALGKSFFFSFRVKRPELTAHSFQSLAEIVNQLVVVDCFNDLQTTLRGQFEYLPGSKEILFLGSPWFGSMEQVVGSKLSIKDFAFHDPLIDLLHVLKTQEITNDDLKELFKTVNKQKEELKLAAKEIQDIALFPMQNPDPLIRIDTYGNVLKQNPVAEKFITFKFNGKSSSASDFWKIFAKLLDPTAEREVYEAESSGKIYSFVVKSIPEFGYFNVYGRDITQQKEDENHIKLLSLVASANENGVVFVNEKGVIYWCNDGMEMISGHSRDVILGKTLIDLLKGPLSDEQIIRQMSDDLNLHRSLVYELIHYRKDGSWYWGKTTGQPIQFENGLNHFFVIIEDVTIQKQKEEQLRVLSSIAAENTHGVVISSKEGQVEWVNKSYINMTGYSSEELINKKPGKFLQGYDTNPDTIAYISRQIHSGEPFICEILNYHKSGRTYWVRIQGQALKDENGNVVKYFAIEEDITDRKKFEKTLQANEEKYQNLITNMHLGLMEVSADQKIVFANKRMMEMLDLPEEEIIGKDTYSFLDIESTETVKTKFDNRKSGIAEAYELKISINGKEHWWFLSSAPKFNESREFIGSIIVCLDIDERKELEQQLIIAREKAEQLGKTKEIFLANMSHEIRTPMNAIIGMSNQLAKSVLKKEQQMYLNTIQTASENLLIIVNDILDFSKIEAGKLDLEHIGFDPRHVISQVMQVMMYKAEEKGILFNNVSTDSKLAQVLLGDPFRINQVLLNLTSNAIKFTEKGGVDITLEVLEDNLESQKIKITVKDTGIGMEDEFIKQMFDKFTREYKSGNLKFEGTGLGMSITKDLIGLMGGKIIVNSKKGVGTSVSITLELEKGKESDLHTNEILQIPDNFLSGKRILVVDDNDHNRLVASIILQNYGAAITEAYNGQEAIDEVKIHPIDLILMDILMPVVDGFEATGKIRQMGFTLPIIALTANAIKGENEKCLAVGMNDYISKPFKEEHFINTIAKWLLLFPVPQLEKPADTSPLHSETLYDLDTLKAFSRGNDSFIIKMVKLFCEQTPLEIAEMTGAFHQNDLSGMGKIAHKLKPNFDNFNINLLKEDIQIVENAGKDNLNLPQLKDLLNNIENTCKLVIAQMKKDFPDI